MLAPPRHTSGAALGPDLHCASRALCPYAPGEPSTHSPVGTRSFPAPTSDESIVRQTTGLRLPRYSLASREGDRPVALSRSWKRMPPLALDGSACHRRPDGHHVAPSPAQGQLPITNCWGPKSGPVTMSDRKTRDSHNAEPQTRDSHDTGSQDPGPPHAGQPRIHMSFGRTRPQPINRLSLSRAGCPTAPEPGAAATPGGRSSRLRTW